MPIAINLVPARPQAIAVDVVPADWRTYLTH